jgi:hypothetical protein
MIRIRVKPGIQLVSQVAGVGTDVCAAVASYASGTGALDTDCAGGIGAVVHV